MNNGAIQNELNALNDAFSTDISIERVLAEQFGSRILKMIEDKHIFLDDGAISVKIPSLRSVLDSTDSVRLRPPLVKDMMQMDKVSKQNDIEKMVTLLAAVSKINVEILSNIPAKDLLLISSILTLFFLS